MPSPLDSIVKLWMHDLGGRKAVDRKQQDFRAATKHENTASIDDELYLLFDFLFYPKEYSVPFLQDFIRATLKYFEKVFSRCSNGLARVYVASCKRICSSSDSSVCPSQLIVPFHHILRFKISIDKTIGNPHPVVNPRHSNRRLCLVQTVEFVCRFRLVRRLRQGGQHSGFSQWLAIWFGPSILKHLVIYS